MKNTFAHIISNISELSGRGVDLSRGFKFTVKDVHSDGKDRQCVHCRKPISKGESCKLIVPFRSGPFPGSTAYIPLVLDGLGIAFTACLSSTCDLLPTIKDKA